MIWQNLSLRPSIKDLSSNVWGTGTGAGIGAAAQFNQETWNGSSEGIFRLFNFDGPDNALTFTIPSGEPEPEPVPEPETQPEPEPDASPEPEPETQPEPEPETQPEPEPETQPEPRTRDPA